MPKKKPTKVHRYDGQSIWTSSDSAYASYSDYELGSFLGGGAAGVVYEAECFKTKRHLAVKVLNPIGYKLAPSGSLCFCEVAIKGQPYGDCGGGFGGRGGRGGGHGVMGGGAGSGGAGKMSEKHVWWLVNTSTRHMIAAYYDARTGVLKEMTLPKCIEVWGLGDDKGRRRDRSKRERERDRIRQDDRADRVFVGGEWLSIPTAPHKFDKFLRARASILREINNMLQLSEHPNILRLHEALELVQDSKATIFLVLELARGGELFDRIKVDCGADEGAARQYFRQLLSGVRHCHDRGVCHRDLKPENLLLADPDDSSVLKIADFGFSALFRELESESSSGDDSSGPTPPGGGGLGPTPLRRQASSGLGGRARGARGAGMAVGGHSAGFERDVEKGRGVKRLKSVVGSPYYVAPEVLREESGHGYDGTKADVWSMGVILYAMLAGNLPFEKELLTCPRFAKFGAWARQTSATSSLRAHCSGNPKDAMDMDCLDYPSWFFPQHFSFAARSLLAGLLHPDASSRLSVRQALRHPWVLDGRLYAGSGGSSSDGSDFSIGPRVPAVDRQAPDPPDIPSELLGADSDTDDEEARERKTARNPWDHSHVQHTAPRTQQPQPSIVAARPRSDAGSHGDSGCGLAATVGLTAVGQAGVGRGGTPGTDVTVSARAGRREDGVDTGTDATGVRGSSRAPAREGVGTASQISPPKPAPPPPVALRSNVMQNASCTSSQSKKEGAGGHRTIAGAGGGINLLEKTQEGTVLNDAAGDAGCRQGVSPRAPDTTPVGDASAAAIAAEAAEEEAAAARQAASMKAALGAEAATSAGMSFRTSASVGHGERRAFATPPKTRSARPLDVFSSPPLAPVGCGRSIDEDEHEFLLDAGPTLPPEPGRAKSRDGLPPSGAGHARSTGGGHSRALSAAERPLSMGVAGIALVEAGSGKREGVIATPPAFQDLVKRSTRFMTSVPAAVVLRKIATIINADAHPLPYPYRNIKQKAVVHQDDYKLEVMRGGVLVCTVQIYLLGGEQRAAQYMVEFLRGQLDIFLFKRFYEDVRCKLNDLVKKDYSLALLESGTCTHRLRRFSNLA